MESRSAIPQLLGIPSRKSTADLLREDAGSPAEATSDVQHNISVASERVQECTA